MNLNFYFWIRKFVEREIVMCEGIVENDIFFENLLVINEDISEMLMVFLNWVENGCKLSDYYVGIKVKIKW